MCQTYTCNIGYVYTIEEIIQPGDVPKILAGLAIGSTVETATKLPTVRIPAVGEIRPALWPARGRRAESHGVPSSRPPSSLAGATWLSCFETRPENVDF